MSNRWVVPGSERRELLPGSEVLGDEDPAQEATVTLVVRSKRPGIPPPGSMSREAFAQTYGADASDWQRWRKLHVLTV